MFHSRAAEKHQVGSAVAALLNNRLKNGIG